MKVILFLMFFVAPPGPPVKKDQDSRVWQLQSTTTMEFASENDCKKVGAEIQSAANTTYTVTVRGWCFVTAGAPAFRPFQQLEKDEPEKGPPDVKIERLAPR